MLSARQDRLHRKATVMTIVVALQALAAALFMADFLADIASEGWTGHLIGEGAAAIALLVAVGIGAFQVRSLIEQARADELAFALSRQAVADLIRQRFAEWKLTPAEADVALFAIKGADVAAIAAMRMAAVGTVRAQLTRIYAKAGVTSHSALVSLFLDDLIDPALVQRGSDVAAS